MGLAFMDDDLMKVFFKDHPQCVERLLRPIMAKPDLTVQKIKVEDVLNNLHGHGVRFDIHAVDSQNKHYDIELQRSDDGEHIVYVNGEYAGNDEIGQLMHDIRCSEADGIKDSVLAAHMKDLKSNEAEVALMCKAVEKYAEDYAARKAEQEKLESIRNLVKNLGLTAEKAMEAIGIPQKDFKRYLALL